MIELLILSFVIALVINGFLLASDNDRKLLYFLRRKIDKRVKYLEGRKEMLLSSLNKTMRTTTKNINESDDLSAQEKENKIRIFGISVEKNKSTITREHDEKIRKIYFRWNPILLCAKCMPSVWGTILFFTYNRAEILTGDPVQIAIDWLTVILVTVTFSAFINKHV